MELKSKRLGGKHLKVSLLDCTGIDTLIKATAMPYQSKETRGLTKRVWDSGHRSVVRHGMASFLIEGVSQSLLRQISRHPMINLTVKSSRYCDMSNVSVYIPSENIELLEFATEDEYLKDMELIMNIYRKWKKKENDQNEDNRKKGIKTKEIDVAKLFLPLGSTTDLVVSGNYQALFEWLELRLCARTEVEFRQLALEISKILKQLIPEVFGNLGCRADEYKICGEAKGCGKYKTKKEIGLI